MLAMVTGASRGLDRPCAHELATQGAELLLVPRDRKALVEVVAVAFKKPGQRIDCTFLRAFGDSGGQHVCQTHVYKEVLR